MSKPAGDEAPGGLGMFVVYQPTPGDKPEVATWRPVGICMAPSAKQAATAFEPAWGPGLRAKGAPDASTEDLLRVGIVALVGVLGEFRQLVAEQQQAAALMAQKAAVDRKIHSH